MAGREEPEAVPAESMPGTLEATHGQEEPITAARAGPTASPFTDEDPDANVSILPAGAERVRLKAKGFILNIGHDVQSTLLNRFHNLQGTVHSQLRNLQDNVANLRHSTGTSPENLRRRWVYHYDHTDFGIRSLRKLFDVIEQNYAYVSIILLLVNVVLEAAAFGIYLRAQDGHVTKDWKEFDWGLDCFIAEVLISAIFMSSWIVLLAVETKKWAYILNARSLMNYVSSGWMLFIGVGALLTWDRAWTHVYAPMFLRVWWLHESLLSLLHYPQVSVFFTENRLEMIRSMTQCIAVIGISVGILQAVESFSGNPVEYFDMVYMMLMSFSSIGYGDVTPLTVEGRLLMIVFIGVGISYFIPILEYVANLGVHQLSYTYYTTWFKRTDHVVICGNIEYDELRMQLKNIFAEDRHYLNMSVVLLLREQPSARVLLLLNSPKYRSAVHVLVGDPGVAMDLDRCNARGASALFLLGAGTNSGYYSDYEVAAQAMMVDKVVPDVPLYILVHRSRYAKSVMPRGAHVLEFERLSRNLLGLGCVLPGMIPFVANLVRMFDPMTNEALWELRDFKDLLGLSGGGASLRAVRKMLARKRQMLTYGAATIELGLGAEPNWMRTYEASLAQHIDTVEAPPPVYQGHYTFVSLAQLLYRTDITLIGVVRREGGPSAADDHENSVVELAPRGSLADVQKLIVICDARRSAQDIVDEIVNDALTNPATHGSPPSSKTQRSKGGKRYRSTVTGNTQPLAMRATAVTVVPISSADDIGVSPSVTVNTLPTGSPLSTAHTSPTAAVVRLPPSHVREERTAESPHRSVVADYPNDGDGGRKTTIMPSGVHTTLTQMERGAARSERVEDSGSLTPPNYAESALSAVKMPQLDGMNDRLGVASCETLKSSVSASRRPSSPVLRSAPSSLLCVESDVRPLKNHYVFIDLSAAHERTSWSNEAAIQSLTAKAADYYDVMHPVRQHDPGSDIVLLANEANFHYLKNLWEEDDTTGPIIFVHGCGLFTSDLRRCNITKAAAVVIFSAGDRCDEHGDSLSVLVTLLVRRLIDEEKDESAADIPIVVEVDKAEFVPLSSPARVAVSEDANRSSEWVAEPSFMSGCVVCRHMLDTGLQEMYFVPELLDVLEQLLSPQTDSLLVTVMAPDAEWRTYEEATTFGLDNALLPLAIHRFHEMVSGDETISFRYIITNPPPSFPLRGDDFIYCLKL